MDWLTPEGFAAFTGALVIMRGVAEWWLDQFNVTHIQGHQGKMPPAWKSVMDASTFSRSVNYTVAKGKFSQWSGIYGTLILLAALFSGLLPVMEQTWTGHLGASIWIQSGFLCTVATLLALFDLPWNFWSQFHLEERFGFNKSNRKLWAVDQLTVLKVRELGDKLTSVVSGLARPITTLALGAAVSTIVKLSETEPSS